MVLGWDWGIFCCSPVTLGEHSTEATTLKCFWDNIIFLSHIFPYPLHCIIRVVIYIILVPQALAGLSTGKAQRYPSLQVLWM